MCEQLYTGKATKIISGRVLAFVLDFVMVNKVKRLRKACCVANLRLIVRSKHFVQLLRGRECTAIREVAETQREVTDRLIFRIDRRCEDSLELVKAFVPCELIVVGLKTQVGPECLGSDGLLFVQQF